MLRKIFNKMIMNKMIKINLKIFNKVNKKDSILHPIIHAN